MLDTEDKQKLIWKVEDINIRKDVTLTKRKAEEWGRWIENSLRAEGHKEGYQDGIEQGIINTIKSMIENNLDYETISKVTNKSIDEIKEIEETLKVE